MSHKCVLIVSNTGDIHCDFLVEACDRLNVKYFRLNTDRFYLSGDLAWDILQQTGSFKIDGHECHLEDVGLLIYRRPEGIHHRRKDIPSWQGFLLDAEWGSVEYALSSLVKGRVINPIHGSVLAQNKIIQLVAAKESGLKVPETIISTNSKYLKTFAERYDVVTKGIRNAHIIVDGVLRSGHTAVVSSKSLEGYDAQGCPTLLQQQIKPRAIWRIVTIGQKVLGVRLTGEKLHQKTDSRVVERELDGEVRDVPLEIQKGLIAMCSKLNINFASSDLIEDQDGNFWFIDLNPEGQWAYLELDFGVKISDEIIKFGDF